MASLEGEQRSGELLHGSNQVLRRRQRCDNNLLLARYTGGLRVKGGIVKLLNASAMFCNIEHFELARTRWHPIVGVKRVHYYSFPVSVPDHKGTVDLPLSTVSFLHINEAQRRERAA